MRRLMLIAGLLLAAPSAQAATWTVKGAGFGHGVGMSAWGAYGYGKHGATAREILDHYYTGIDVTELDGARKVRVLLKTAGGSVRFSGATRACGRRLKAGTTYRARRSGSSIVVDGTSCGGRLHATGPGPLDISNLGEYRGALEVVPAGGGINVVNQVEVNDYVRGSLGAELFPSWPAATLEAFAIAQRSIALSTNVGGTGYALYPDTRTQLYKGVAVETERTDAAVAETRDQVVTYDGAIAQTTYFSSSGGQTESRFLGGPEVPYIRSVDDPYDYYSPLHRWTLRFTRAQMNERLAGHLKGRLRRIKVLERGDTPRIVRARLVGTRGNTVVSGDTLRATLGLYDRWAYFSKG
jgi:stage II sporulation protein D